MCALTTIMFYVSVSNDIKWNFILYCIELSFFLFVRFGLAENVCQIAVLLLVFFFFFFSFKCWSLLMNLHVKYVSFFVRFLVWTIQIQKNVNNCCWILFLVFFFLQMCAQPTLNIVIFNIKLFASFWHHRKEKKRIVKSRCLPKWTQTLINAFYFNDILSTQQPRRPRRHKQQTIITLSISWFWIFSLFFLHSHTNPFSFIFFFMHAHKYTFILTVNFFLRLINNKKDKNL